jgi:hypothetical protein
VGVGGERGAVFEIDAAGKLAKRCFGDRAFDLREIRFGRLPFWIGEAVVEAAVVGEQQQAFAIVIEAARDVYPRRQRERGQRGPVFRVREFRMDEVRLVERDQQRAQPRFE